MNWKSFLLGLGIGLVGGYAASKALVHTALISPEKALASAKKLFKQNGPISGSWIYMKPQSYQKEGFTFTVYKGGISKRENGQLRQYQFVADAKTGSIIDVEKIS